MYSDADGLVIGTSGTGSSQWFSVPLTSRIGTFGGHMYDQDEVIFFSKSTISQPKITIVVDHLGTYPLDRASNMMSSNVVDHRGPTDAQTTHRKVKWDISEGSQIQHHK
jgi:hypothetical protein